MNLQLSKLVLALTASVFCCAAWAELVLVVNPKNPAGSLTAEQASQFYLGISNSFVPVDLAESSPLRAEFYRKVTQREPGQVRAIWAKLTFTGKGRPPKEYGSDEEVKKAVASDPNGIGYIAKSSVDASIKVVLAVP